MEWGKWDQASRFEATFESASLPDEQRAVMKAALLHEKHLGLRQRFASYVCDRLPPAWWATKIQDYSPTLEMQPDGSATFTAQAAGEMWPSVQLPRRYPRLRFATAAGKDEQTL